MNAIDERMRLTPSILPGRFGLPGCSQPMTEVHHLISKILHSQVTVLLRGESGTGKAFVARAIHKNGARRHQVFTVQSCTGVSEEVLERALFGTHLGELGSKPSIHRGLFELAEGGTLFFEEIGDLPASTQNRLARVLQEGVVRALGSSKVHKLNVRIIAATRQDLAQKVAEGNFREDLFYRLSHFPIELPPLRSRGLDILELARTAATDACQSNHQKACVWSEAVTSQLLSYSFPGNIPELKALVERAVLLCGGGELLPEHFTFPPGAVANSPRTLRQQMNSVERQLLLDSLQRNRGNRTRTASELGIARRTLLYRMERLQIGRADS